MCDRESDSEIATQSAAFEVSANSGESPIPESSDANERHH